MLEDLGARSRLDDPAGVHDRDVVGDGIDDREVVGDVDERAPLLRASSFTSSSTRACVLTSSPVVGSSSTTTFGRHASAIAIATRCCWPPQSSKG